MTWASRTSRSSTSRRAAPLRLRGERQHSERKRRHRERSRKRRRHGHHRALRHPPQLGWGRGTRHLQRLPRDRPPTSASSPPLQEHPGQPERPRCRPRKASDSLTSDETRPEPRKPHASTSCRGHFGRPPPQRCEVRARRCGERPAGAVRQRQRHLQGPALGEGDGRWASDRHDATHGPPQRRRPHGRLRQGQPRRPEVLRRPPLHPSGRSGRSHASARCSSTIASRSAP